MKELIPLVKQIVPQFGIEVADIMAFMSVESGGLGFDTDTHKIIIQFEPSWFKKLAPFAPSGLWSLNGVERQLKEWEAFNDAFSKNPDKAMQSTSIGIGQVMGFNFKRLGYASVGAMWDDAKKGIDRQIWQMCKYIATDIKLISALKAHDWDGVASIYNGSGYKTLAVKYHRLPYDQSMKIAYNTYEPLC